MRTALIYLISILLMILCVPMSVSLVYALIDHGGWVASSDQLAFLATILLGLSLGYIGFHRSKLAGVHTDIKPTDAFLIVSMRSTKIYTARIDKRKMGTIINPPLTSNSMILTCSWPPVDSVSS